MKSINILGFGTMGIQLAAFFCVIGYKVTVWNRTFPNIKLKRLSIEKKILEKNINCVADKHDIVFVDKIDLLAPAITIEVLAEDIAVKQDVLNRLPFDLEKLSVFTNSSSFTPDEIHKEAHALHFFNPLHSVKLVETTCPITSMQLFSDLENAGMTVVHAKMNRGYIANYILFREIAASIMLVEKFGYDTATIDLAQKCLGRQSSIFDVIDFVGVDVTKSIIDNLHENDDSIITPYLLTLALESGVLGRKNKTSIRSVLDNYQQGNNLTR